MAEFEHYLRKWRLRKYGNYPILYLGFHGDPGVLYVENRRIPPVDLDWLEERLAGRCKGRIIHFGSCGTLATHGGRLNRFLRRTDALAVCGFKTAIGWMKSAAFEIILLSEFQHNALTRPGVEAVKKRVLGFAPRLARELQFRLVVAPK